MSTKVGLTRIPAQSPWSMRGHDLECGQTGRTPQWLEHRLGCFTHLLGPVAHLTVSHVKSSQGWWKVRLDNVCKVLSVVPDSLHAHSKLGIIIVAEIGFISS